MVKRSSQAQGLPGGLGLPSPPELGLMSGHLLQSGCLSLCRATCLSLCRDCVPEPLKLYSQAEIQGCVWGRWGC